MPGRTGAVAKAKPEDVAQKPARQILDWQSVGLVQACCGAGGACAGVEAAFASAAGEGGGGAGCPGKAAAGGGAGAAASIRGVIEGGEPSFAAGEAGRVSFETSALSAGLEEALSDAFLPSSPPGRAVGVAAGSSFFLSSAAEGAAAAEAGAGMLALAGELAGG